MVAPEAAVEPDDQLLILDRAVALERVEGDLELLSEISSLFLEECPRLLSEIRSAVEQGDSEALHRAAHALKGSVGNFGAAPAFQAALHLERLGRSARLDEAGEAYRHLESEISRLVPALADLAR